MQDLFDPTSPAHWIASALFSAGAGQLLFAWRKASLWTKQLALFKTSAIAGNPLEKQLEWPAFLREARDTWRAQTGEQRTGLEIDSALRTVDATLDGHLFLVRPLASILIIVALIATFFGMKETAQGLSASLETQSQMLGADSGGGAASDSASMKEYLGKVNHALGDMAHTFGANVIAIGFAAALTFFYPFARGKQRKLRRELRLFADRCIRPKVDTNQGFVEPIIQAINRAYSSDAGGPSKHQRELANQFDLLRGRIHENTTAMQALGDSIARSVNQATTNSLQEARAAQRDQLNSLSPAIKEMADQYRGLVTIVANQQSRVNAIVTAVSATNTSISQLAQRVDEQLKATRSDHSAAVDRFDTALKDLHRNHSEATSAMISSFEQRHHEITAWLDKAREALSQANRDLAAGIGTQLSRMDESAKQQEMMQTRSLEAFARSAELLGATTSALSDEVKGAIAHQQTSQAALVDAFEAAVGDLRHAHEEASCALSETSAKQHGEALHFFSGARGVFESMQADFNRALGAQLQGIENQVNSNHSHQLAALERFADSSASMAQTAGSLSWNVANSIAKQQEEHAKALQAFEGAIDAVRTAIGNDLSRDRDRQLSLLERIEMSSAKVEQAIPSLASALSEAVQKLQVAHDSHVRTLAASATERHHDSRAILAGIPNTLADPTAGLAATATGSPQQRPGASKGTQARLVEMGARSTAAEGAFDVSNLPSNISANPGSETDNPRKRAEASLAAELPDDASPPPGLLTRDRRNGGV